MIRELAEFKRLLSRYIILLKYWEQLMMRKDEDLISQYLATNKEFLKNSFVNGLIKPKVIAEYAEKIAEMQSTISELMEASLSDNDALSYLVGLYIEFDTTQRMIEDMSKPKCVPPLVYVSYKLLLASKITAWQKQIESDFVKCHRNAAIIVSNICDLTNSRIYIVLKVLHVFAVAGLPSTTIINAIGIPARSGSRGAMEVLLAFCEMRIAGAIEVLVRLAVEEVPCAMKAFGVLCRKRVAGAMEVLVGLAMEGVPGTMWVFGIFCKKQIDGAIEALVRLAIEEAPGAMEVFERLVRARVLGAMETLVGYVVHKVLGALEVFEGLVMKCISDVVDALKSLARDQVPGVIEFIVRSDFKGSIELLKELTREGLSGVLEAINVLYRENQSPLMLEILRDLVLISKGRKLGTDKKALKILKILAADGFKGSWNELIAITRNRKYQEQVLSLVTECVEKNDPEAIKALSALAHSKNTRLFSAVTRIIIMLLECNNEQVLNLFSRLVKDHILSVELVQKNIQGTVSKDIRALEILAFLVQEEVPGAMIAFEALAQKHLNKKRKNAKLLQKVRQILEEVMWTNKARNAQALSATYVVYTVLYDGHQVPAIFDSTSSKDPWFDLISALHNDGRSWDEIGQLQEAINSVRDMRESDSQEFLTSVLEEYREGGIDRAFQLIEAITLSKTEVKSEGFISNISFANLLQVFSVIFSNLLDYQSTSAPYPIYPFPPGGDPGGLGGDGLYVLPEESGSMLSSNMTAETNYTVSFMGETARE